jgi:predicted dehydrogenase
MPPVPGEARAVAEIEQMPDVVRLAMLGTGFIAEFRAQVYARIREAKVVAVLGRDADRTRAFAEKNGIEFAVTSYEALLAGPVFDAVDLCLPNHVHHEAALRMAAAGKHILCEKPLGRTAQEAATMLEAARAARVIHCYGENLLFSPDMTEIRAIVERGIVGRPLWMRGREGHFGPHSPWFYQKALSGGGALLDMGCHIIGAFNALGKRRAEAVFAHTPTLHHATDCEDNALALVRYEGGLVGQAEASWTQRGGMAVDFEVWGDEGMITYDRSGLSQPIKVFSRQHTDRYFSEKAEHRQGWLFPTVQEYWRYGYYDQIRHFVECVQGRCAPLLTFEDGLAVNRIIDAAYASAKSGGWEPVA